MSFVLSVRVDGAGPLVAKGACRSPKTAFCRFLNLVLVFWLRCHLRNCHFLPYYFSHEDLNGKSDPYVLLGLATAAGEFIGTPDQTDVRWLLFSSFRVAVFRLRFSRAWSQFSHYHHDLDQV